MISQINMNKERPQGFTLIELLIVVSIIAVLSVALVFMLNPAETLKKARDTQRISDLKTIKTTLGVMLTSTTTPSLDGTFGADDGGICITRGDGGAPTSIRIAYSSPTVPTSGIAVNGGSDAIADFSSGSDAFNVSAEDAGKVDGGGWIPINLKALTGGSPISNFPIDPTNEAPAAAASLSNLVYRYACQNGSSTSKPSFVFEINAALESNAYTVDDDFRTKDGGDNTDMYEVGNSLNLLPETGLQF